MKKRSLFILFISIAALAAGCSDNHTQKQPPLPSVDQVVCGDSKIGQGEACDDGNTTDGDGCSSTCQIEDGYICDTNGCHKSCGDSILDVTKESCDDGNTTDGDGCSSTCQIEDGYICDTNGCHKSCGDGTFDKTVEECEDGNTTDGDGCSSSCKIETGYVCDPVTGTNCKVYVCGDGKREKGKEECDDGNTTDGDGCSSTCQVEPGYTCDTSGCRKSNCGNKHVDVADGEECDLGTDAQGHLLNTGVYGGCLPNCKFAPHCGDGQVIPKFEECDDGNNTDGDGCSSTCQIEKPAADPLKWKCPSVGGACTVNTCGNGKIEGKETCDDGNRTPGDGCNQYCQVEHGYSCLTEGAPCLAYSCGDGVVAGDEECDDGNDKEGDGCNKFCQIEEHYFCTVDPHTQKSSCQMASCGNSTVESPAENCDDGNTSDADGCSSTCQVEPGYKCQPDTTGKSHCSKVTCGDNHIDGYEQCDDGNNADGDGCDSHCRLERGADGTNAYCPTDASGHIVPGKCFLDKKTGKTDTCGNGIVEGTEVCDDGNHVGGDGCDTQCQPEITWKCHKNSRTGKTKCGPVCGDGITFFDLGEECDDGNLVSGDGCSSDCKIEPGFTCSGFYGKTLPDTISLPMTIRDFLPYGRQKGSVIGHADFETPGGYTCEFNKNKGALADRLGSDGTPVLSATSAADPNACFGHVLLTAASNYKTTADGKDALQNAKEAFHAWYHDDPKYNTKFIYNLVLTKDTVDPKKYVVGPNVVHDFFPIDGMGFGNFGTHNFHFTDVFRTYFVFHGNETFDFTGDDDLWVYINGRLFVDLGGIHPPKTATKTLTATDKVVDGKTYKYSQAYDLYEGGVYEIAVFHAERHTSASNYGLSLTGFVGTGTAVCVAKCGDGVVVKGEACDDNNTIDGDGCSSTCTVEPGYACQGSPSVCNKSNCGDGTREYPEQCDPGSDSLGHVITTDPHCAADCTFKTCNDGTLDPGEECDRHGSTVLSTDNSKTCGEHCLFVECGNGIVEGPDEECDDGNHIDTDGCTNACKWPVCGDGITTPSIGEACDDGPNNNNGQYGGCLAGCVARAPFCGDLVVNGTEQCDEGAQGTEIINNCKSDCTYSFYCGDGIVNGANEQCDDGNDNDDDGCTSTCQPTLGYFCSVDQQTHKSLCIGLG